MSEHRARSWKYSKKQLAGRMNQLDQEQPAARIPRAIRAIEDATPALVELWRVVMARKWFVLAVTCASIFLGLLVLRQLTPVYRSTATILIEQGPSKVVSIEQLYPGATGGREYLITQAEFLKSRNVAMRVIDKLELASHPEFSIQADSPGALSRIRTWVRLRLLGSRGAPGEESDLDSQLFRAFSERVDIQLVRMSQLVNVSFESADRKLAADAANAIAESFVEADMDARYAMVQQANSWLSERVETLRASLSASEQALQAFREKKGVIDKQSAAQGGAARQLEVTAQLLADARVRRAQAEQAYNQARSRGATGAEVASAVMGNPLVARAELARSQAKRGLADVSQRLGPAHPLYKAAQAELAAAENGFEQAVASAISALRKEYEAAQAVVRSLERELRATRGSIQDQNREEFELARYEREVSTNRQIYETFLARLKETVATTGLQDPVARVVDPAVPALTPTRPSKAGILLLSGLLGLASGVGMVMLLHRFDRTIQTVEMAEAKLQHPVIAALPKLKPNDQASAHRMVLARPDAEFSEAIRTARTSILLSSVDESSKIILVTSARADEGKSTCAINLALAQKQTMKTLLVEADMRRPTHARLLELEGLEVGLSELIAGTASLKDCIRVSPESGLHVLSSGAIPPNPLELLSSKRFRRLLSELGEMYEMIVVDSPPISLVSDAIVVAAESTAVLFVVRAGSTPYQLARHSLRKLAMAGSPVLGLILNDLDFRRAQKYYGDSVGYAAGGYGGYGGYTEATKRKVEA